METLLDTVHDHTLPNLPISLSIRHVSAIDGIAVRYRAMQASAEPGPMEQAEGGISRWRGARPNSRAMCAIWPVLHEGFPHQRLIETGQLPAFLGGPVDTKAEVAQASRF